MATVRRLLGAGLSIAAKVGGHPSSGRMPVRAGVMFLGDANVSAFSRGMLPALPSRCNSGKPFWGFFGKEEPAVQGKMEPAVQDTVEPAVQNKGNEPAGDDLDALRREIAGSAPAATREEKLAAVLAELVEREERLLRWYKEAREEGDTVEMDKWRGSWKSTLKKLEMLRSDPDKFAKLYGVLYKL